MGKRPYFIKKDIGDTFAFDLFISRDMNKYIKDLISPIKNFNSYYYKILLGNFHTIMSMPKYVDASELPVANYPSIQTWEKIIRICVEIIERCYLNGFKTELFEGLNLTITNISNLQKVEFYSEEDVPKIESIKEIDDLQKEVKVAPADRLRKLLIHYHDLYDGSYKTCLSLFHFICDLLEKNYTDKKKFTDYMNDDVSFKIKKLKEYSSQIKLQYEINWLLIGSDNHIRNAIAHKRWKFENGFVVLRDIDGWSKKINFFEIEDLIRSINIAIKGMQAGILIGFCKYQEEIFDFIPKETYDEETINGILYYFANDTHFVLDDFYIENKSIIHCRLKELVIGFNREIVVGYKSRSARLSLPPVPKRSDRVKSFIIKSVPLVWNYREIKVDVYDFQGNAVGIIVVNLEKWSEMYFSKQKYTKEDYESFVTLNTVIDENDK